MTQSRLLGAGNELSTGQATVHVRVTELFVEGTELVLDQHDPVLVWINKLNPFQLEEARRDGQAARTRFTLALNDPRSEESQAFDLQGSRITDEVVARGMAQSKYNQFLVQASDELRADEEWKDKADALERANSDLANRPDDDPEVVAMQQLSDDYFAEMQRRVDEKREAEFAALTALPHEELRDKYRQAWIEERATGAFLTAYRITEMWFADARVLRQGQEGGRQLGPQPCEGHRIQLCDARDQITKLPDGLIGQVRAVIDGLAVDERAGKDSPPSPASSTSSPTPSAAAGSAASGQAATSPEPATTSTQR